MRILVVGAGRDRQPADECCSRPGMRFRQAAMRSPPAAARQASTSAVLEDAIQIPFAPAVGRPVIPMLMRRI